MSESSSRVHREVEEIFAVEWPHFQKEGDVSLEAENQLHAPDLSEGMPDQLWSNLGLFPELRGKLNEDLFFARAAILGHRLDILLDNTCQGLKRINRGFTDKMLDVVAKRLPGDGKFDGVMHGISLAIEAYQIESGLNLIAGFENLSEEDADAVFSRLPQTSFWGRSKVYQMVNRDAPEPEHNGVFMDAQQIARYSQKEVIATGYGAWTASRLLHENWQKLETGGLPAYVPSGYVDEDSGLHR